MELLYLYNSGILISYKNESILIDGIFSDKNDFDKMPTKYKELLLNKEGLFKNIKALLFTHCHEDHYDDEFIEEYKEKYNDVLILTPEKFDRDSLHSLHDKFSFGEYEISLIETGHIGPGFDDCKHYAYKVCVDEKSVVITGDMDPKKLCSVLNIYGTEVDAFFINPALLMFEMKYCEETLLKSISNLFVYHIPSAENDIYGYRIMTNRMRNKVNKCLKKVLILDENMKRYNI